MASILVTRDQFNITPQSVTHKPTDASFVPRSGNPGSGYLRLGRLEMRGSKDNYDPEVVKKMMMQLWAEYLTANSDLFYSEVSDGHRDTESRLSDERHSL